jgi:hypothetical protein
MRKLHCNEVSKIPSVDLSSVGFYEPKPFNGGSNSFSVKVRVRSRGPENLFQSLYRSSSQSRANGLATTLISVSYFWDTHLLVTWLDCHYRKHMHQKNKVSIKAVCICLVLISIPLAACSSSAQQEKVTTTTIDPLILELQEQVETLESILNTTTVAPKPAKSIVEIRRGFSGNLKFDQHECREITVYSDGTALVNSTWWANTTKDWRGEKQYYC